MTRNSPYPGLRAGGVRLSGYGDDEISAYHAAPEEQITAGVVVLHHMLGLDEATREIAMRFAAHGYAAICPNLHAREARGDVGREDAAAACRAAGGVPDARLLGDVQGALDHLRDHDQVLRAGVIGYCSGGRQAFLVACSLEVDATVDCYGSFLNRTPPPTIPLRVTPVLPLAEGLRAPILCVYGADDPNPSPADAAEIAAELDRLGKVHESAIYPDAGHGFFDTGSTRYSPAAAADGWQRVLDFFATHLAPCAHVL